MSLVSRLGFKTLNFELLSPVTSLACLELINSRPETRNSRRVVTRTRAPKLRTLRILGKSRHQEFNLVADGRVPIEEYYLFSFDPAPTAMRAIPHFAKKFFRAHLNILPLRGAYQFFQARLMLRFGHTTLLLSLKVMDL